MTYRRLSRRSFALPLLCALAVLLVPAAAAAQGGMETTTPRGADEGQGPFDRMVIRGVTIIDGTGSPAPRADGRGHREQSHR